MKRMLKNMCFVLALSAQSLIAQVPKKMVVEHFTNTKCGVCSSRNPGFYTNLSTQQNVVYLSVHPSSPYSACLLSQQNKIENDARTNYYGVYGATPRLVINGNVISSSVNYSDNSIFSPYVSLTSPAVIKITQVKFGSDSIRVKVVIKTAATHTLGGLSLFVGLAEDTVTYTGSNGEPKHYSVLRKALGSATGVSLTLPAIVGDSVVRTYTASPQSFWNINRMNALAILQETSTKNLVQAEKYVTPVVTTGIDNSFFIRSVNLYPNPAKDVIKINSPLHGIKMDVSNSLGQFILSQNLTEGENKLDLSGHINGIYFIRFSDSNQLLYQTRLLLLND